MVPAPTGGESAATVHLRQTITAQSKREEGWRSSLMNSTARRCIRFGATPLLCAIGWAVGSTATAAQQRDAAAVTFSKDVAPILQRSCQNCHHPGSIAPMSLLSYQDARPWAQAIKRRVAQREMPPWFIERNIGIQKFKDDISLSDADIDTIVKWVESGAPEGNPADLPRPVDFDAARWSIGTPDLIVSTPTATIKAVAPDWWTTHGPVASGLLEDRWVKAVETKPTPESQMVVHHAGVVATVGTGRQDPTAEVVDAESSGTGGQISLYEVGRNADIYPDDSGRLIKANTQFTFSMHYHSIGKEVQARTEVGLKFYPRGQVPRFVREWVFIGNVWELDLPAGQDDIRTDSYYVLPRPALFGSFEPHMHTRGVRQCIEVVHTDSRIEPLNCARYNHNWVKVYSYADDVAPLLPAGTVVHVTGWYDNTAKNPRNADPRNWAGWGNRTIDDMAISFVNLVWLTDEQYKEQLEARRKASTSDNR
jgi:hypothetical protein